MYSVAVLRMLLCLHLLCATIPYQGAPRHCTHTVDGILSVLGPMWLPCVRRRLDAVGFDVGARLLELLSWRERVLRRKPEVR
jgi:hypothetical protein